MRCVKLVSKQLTISTSSIWDIIIHIESCYLDSWWTWVQHSFCFYLSFADHLMELSGSPAAKLPIILTFYFCCLVVKTTVCICCKWDQWWQCNWIQPWIWKLLKLSELFFFFLGSSLWATQHSSYLLLISKYWLHNVYFNILNT